MLVQIEQVEQTQPYRDVAEKIGRWVLDLHALLKLREAGDPVFESDNFTIGNE
jgi:hypothetical protein